MTKKTVTVREAMSILGCSRTTLYALISRKRLLPLPKVGKLTRFVEDDVARLAGTLRTA